MRTKKAIYNLIGSISSHFTSMILAFFSQAIFIKTLGTEYLGLSGLLNNVFSMLAVVELGLGSAIVFNLYRPIHEKDYAKINKYLNFYKKCYYIIAMLVIVLSVVIFPFLPLIIGNTTINDSIVNISYFLFMVDIACSYVLSYKRSLLQADQKNYVIDVIHILYLILLNGLQIAILVTTKSFLLYLILKIAFRILENIVISIYVSKKYTFLNNSKEKLSQSEKESVTKKVRGLFLHKIGVFLVGSTDNIIISTFLGIKTVGLYSNYFMIINALKTVINQIFMSFKSSIGNLIVTESTNKVYCVYKRIQFLNFWFAMISSIGIYCVIEDFIIVWIGEQYLLSHGVLLSLVICNYIYITKLCVGNFKEAAGIFYEDRFVPIIESVVNIVMSIFLIRIVGLAGVFIGTIITYMITHVYTYPKLVYKKVFEKGYFQYFQDCYKYFIFTLIIATITKLTTYNLGIIIENNYIRLFVDIFCSLIIPNLFLIIFFNKSSEFKYYVDYIKNRRKRR